MQALLRRWEVEEERQELRLAALDGQIEKLREARARAEEAVEESRQECARLLVNSPSPEDIIYQYGYTEQCLARVADLGRQIAEMMAQREEVEALRLHAARERRRMEIARERELKAFMDEQARLEGIQFDELGVLGSARRRREEAEQEP